MSEERSGFCFFCGNALRGSDFGRQEICTQCRRHTRVCRNCDFYEAGAHNDCRENQADRVVDKERSNFCDYFRPHPHPRALSKQSDALKAKADALFKKKTE